MYLFMQRTVRLRIPCRNHRTIRKPLAFRACCVGSFKPLLGTLVVVVIFSLGEAYQVGGGGGVGTLLDGSLDLGEERAEEVERGWAGIDSDGGVQGDGGRDSQHGVRGGTHV